MFKSERDSKNASVSFFFFLFSFVCAHQKGSWSQTFLAETVETGDKNRDVTDDIFRVPYMFCEAYSTFSQPIGKICDVVTFSRKAIHAKLQNLMSSTFMYFFTNPQDFCARKGNKLSLSYY